MSHTNFHRHLSMTSETRTEVLQLINDIRLSDIELNIDITFPLENMLYGLFDGYLYEDIQIYALELPTPLASRAIRIYDICNRYPKVVNA